MIGIKVPHVSAPKFDFWTPCKAGRIVAAAENRLWQIGVIMIADAGIKDAAAAAAAGVKDIGGPIASAAYSQGHAAASSAASGMGSGSARSSAGSGHGSGDHLAPIFRNSPSGDSSEPSDSKAPSSDSRSGSGGEGARQPWKEEEEKPRPESCVKYFDELWFCYSALLHHKASLVRPSAPSQVLKREVLLWSCAAVRCLRALTVHARLADAASLTCKAMAATALHFSVFG